MILRRTYPLLLSTLLAISALGCGRPDPAPPGSSAARDSAAAPDSLAGGYRAVAVTNGGAITGRVLLAGPAPVLPEFEIINDATSCGPASKNNRLETSNGGIGGVVVYLDGVTQGKPMPALPESALTVDQQGCQYVPHVLVAPLGSTVTFTNSDNVPHNVRVENPATDSMLMNRTQPDRGNRDPFPVRVRGPVSVGCDYHPWMSAYVFGVDNPYYAVTGADGSFSIDGIPPGTYRVRMWLNGIDAVPRRDNSGRLIRYAFGAPHTEEKDIEVSAGGSAAVDFKLTLAADDPGRAFR